MANQQAAFELIRQSAETGERVRVNWNPVTIIGLKALGADELERGVYSGNDRDGRQWIIDMRGEAITERWSL